MRNHPKIKEAERRFNDAMRSGDAVLALHQHRVLTTLYINAEWEVKESLHCTIKQLEDHIDSIEVRLGVFVCGILVALVCGAVWGNQVLVSILLWLYAG